MTWLTVAKENHEKPSLVAELKTWVKGVSL
jgi:hypothetical protein